jgi:hypothetical protein
MIKVKAVFLYFLLFSNLPLRPRWLTTNVRLRAQFILCLGIQRIQPDRKLRFPLRQSLREFLRRRTAALSAFV